MSCCKNGCKPIADETPILAVLLDLDGTLLNTEKATKNILKDFLKNFGKVLDREKENNRLGMMHKESTTSIVKDYDLPMSPEQFSKQIMPFYFQRWPLAKPLPGVNRLIKHLHKHGIPSAVASNSRTESIENKVSHQKGWKESFLAILGSDQVNAGKPAPDIFLEAAKRIGVEAANCLVIEDSLVGVMAGKAAGMKVVAVPSLPSQADRYTIADSVLHSLLEFRPESWGLPPFEDWVGNALLIEPLYVKGLIQNGFLHEAIGKTEDGPNALPDQVSGVYFGWARLSTNEIVKVVMNTGWDHQSTTRIIRPHLIGESSNFLCGQQLQLMLVGFIRQSDNKVNTSMDYEILEEDILTANEALDLPSFLVHKNNLLLLEESFMEGTAVLNGKEE